jgi:hypothetical protein
MSWELGMRVRLELEVGVGELGVGGSVGSWEWEEVGNESWELVEVGNRRSGRKLGVGGSWEWEEVVGVALGRSWEWSFWEVECNKRSEIFD